jgi:hypothetical protein
VSDFRAVDFDTSIESVTWIGMVCVEFDISTDSAGDINRPAASAGGNLFPGLDEDLLAGGLAKILERYAYR